MQPPVSILLALQQTKGARRRLLWRSSRMGRGPGRLASCLGAAEANSMCIYKYRQYILYIHGLRVKSNTRPPSRMYARHGRVTTRAAGGATELLGDGWPFLLLCIVTGMTRLACTSGIIGFGRADDFFFFCFLCSGNSKRLTLYVTQSVVTCRPLTFCLCNYMYLCSSASRFSCGSLFTRLPRFTHKNQIPASNAYLLSPGDRTWGFMRRNKLEGGVWGKNTLFIGA
ncbi:hypothetical protein ACQKWADRAFT_130345 [Trichoderma austrokoningii]